MASYISGAPVLPIHTNTGGTGTNRVSVHEGLSIDGGSTTGGGGDGSGEEGTKWWGCTRGGLGELEGGERGKRQREGSSRRAKTKMPREDPEGGNPL